MCVCVCVTEHSQVWLYMYVGMYVCGGDTSAVGVRVTGGDIVIGENTFRLMNRHTDRQTDRHGRTD